MTTAPKLIREVDRVLAMAEKVSTIARDRNLSTDDLLAFVALRASVKVLRNSLAAEPVGGGDGNTKVSLLAGRYSLSELGKIIADNSHQPDSAEGEQPKADGGASYVHPDGGHYKQGGVWPFVESPGEFTERLAKAMESLPLLGAVRNVLIENPPALSAAPQPEQSINAATEPPASGFRQSDEQVGACRKPSPKRQENPGSCAINPPVACWPPIPKRKWGYPQPEQATLPIPSHVYITDKGALVTGIPQSGWNEESTEAHNCDTNGCGQCHVLYRLDFTDERTQPERPARDGDPGSDAALHFVCSYISFGEADEEGFTPGLLATVKERIDALRTQPPQQADVQNGDRCSLGVGCDEVGLCYASAHGCPDRCGRPDDTHQFKNFHRSLCARFGYTHDEIDWRRDQVSLEEHIAKLIPQQADGGAVESNP